MATRLDRLFLLLETGSTPVVRQSAAEQLGQVQKLHPHELNNLLNKVHKYLCSNLWETRIAAGQAVEAICKNVPQWQPQPQVKDEHGSSPPANDGHLTLAQFDVQKVLQHAASLLGSEGAEYDADDRAAGLEDKEKLARQKQLLNKRLGLDMAGNLGIQTEALFDDSDLVVKKEEFCDARHQKSVAELMQQQMGYDSDMSARERNRAKRKAKLLAKQISREDKQASVDGTNGEPNAKLRKTASVVVEQPADADKLVIDNVLDSTLNMEEMDEWPFEGFCELLLNDLFSWSWETRHGACTGLREVLKLHGQGAGKMANTTQSAMQYMNKVWLEDAAVRIICVLALDRFGDFVADEVVAPVRETCAQTLGVILRCMDTEGTQGVVAALLKLLAQRQWEVRHGGLLGIKYLLAVRQDQTPQLLPVLLPAVFAGLQDRDDDVRAVAAAALVPVADALVKHLPQQVPYIISCLWETLTDLDDLTASTNSIMHLLSTLLAFSHPANSSWASQMHLLVPRLWPFLKHNIASVRKSALETLLTLLGERNFMVPVATWIAPILQDALRHVYQRSLLEHKEDILQVVCQVWRKLLEGCQIEHLTAAVGPWLGVWFCFIMQPPKMPFDPNLLIEAKHLPREMNPATARHRLYEHQQQTQTPSNERKEYIGSTEHGGQPAAVDVAVMRARMTAARCIGLLATYLSSPQPNLPAGVETPLESMSKVLLFHLASKSALQRLAVALVLANWAREQQPCLCSQEVKDRLLVCLSESIYYDEIAMGFTRMQTECRDFVASLKQYGVNMDTVVPPGAVLSLDQALQLCSTTYDQVRIMLRPRHQQTMDERRKSLQVTVNQTSIEWHLLHNRVQCSLACGCVMLQHLPDKLNPVIRPMMEALKKEENHNLQSTVASHLSILLKQCSTRSPNPNAKVIKNLCTVLCSDPAQTPLVTTENAQDSGNTDISANCDAATILTLASQAQLTGKQFRRAAASKKPPTVDPDIPAELATDEDDESKRQLLIQKRGATLALTQIVSDLGADLLSHLPSLWETIFNPVTAVDPCQEYDVNKIDDNRTAAQELITSLQVMETVLPSIAAPLFPKLLQHLPNICHCLKHPYAAIRHMASRALASLAKVALGDTMNYVLDNVLSSLGACDDIIERQGAVECIANIIEQLGLDVLPYIVLLVVPVLGRMSDQQEAVRLMATQCFASLIKLMPLESGIPDPPSMQSHLVEKKEHERQFLEQLLDGSKIKEFSLPVPVKAELRRYQQEGVNWLWFLNQYKLHGILCDDMGLGKTLQSICILAGDHYLRDQEYQKNKSVDNKPLPSIVVCPPTLTGHWVYEIEKFVDAKYINTLHYTGPPAERTKLQKKMKRHNLVVASYDIVRNDIEFFGAIKWNYCILDEGHIIKNGKTKISKAVKQLVCNHRLILSGTPIQNNVLELWSLFDFLMPGFLGTERQFQARYGRPILQSRDAKSSSKEQEAGALAMESLHRQVLPFLLRRLKEDVLQDLPPKIIQDYYCDLSPLQVRLYEDFARSRAKKSVDDSVLGAEEVESKMDLQNRSHIFQALQYLRKVCNHPALVVSQQHPQYEEIMQDLKRQKSSIRELQHAPKLTALRQLLQDCGIGVGSPEAGDAPVVGQHRVLLFCQLKGMLDIVEQDLLKSQMPSVTYLRLDGTVPAGARHGIVNRFNNDPSIDILLLTTHVGGLGLNLTGADIVIFVEHDWNPMKDLQAMDRAHRIGQKKVVTVYRLITKGTLEEKIMGLQKFKLNIANTVISQENASLASMGTDQLLDLFSLDDSEKGQRLGEQSSSDQDNRPATMSTVLNNLTELWDDRQYETEYNLDAFMKSLSRT